MKVYEFYDENDNIIDSVRAENHDQALAITGLPHDTDFSSYEGATYESDEKEDKLSWNKDVVGKKAERQIRLREMTSDEIRDEIENIELTALHGQVDFPFRLNRLEKELAERMEDKRASVKKRIAGTEDAKVIELLIIGYEHEVEAIINMFYNSTLASEGIYTLGGFVRDLTPDEADEIAYILEDEALEGTSIEDLKVSVMPIVAYEKDMEAIEASFMRSRTGEEGIYNLGTLIRDLTDEEEKEFESNK